MGIPNAIGSDPDVKVLCISRDELERMIERILEKKLQLLARDVALMVLVEQVKIRREQEERLSENLIRQLSIRGVSVKLGADGCPTVGPQSAITPAVDSILIVYREQIIEGLKRGTKPTR